MSGGRTSEAGTIEQCLALSTHTPFHSVLHEDGPPQKQPIDRGNQELHPSSNP